MEAIKGEPIRFVDATPDEDYPLRILRAYRENCNCKFVSSLDSIGEEINPALKAMNEANDKRAEILDRAIRKLKSTNSEEEE